MKLIDITVMSAEGLFERKGRVALNVLGILIGCAAVTGLISVADGMNNQVRDQLSIIGTNTLFVIPGEEAKAVSTSLSATQMLRQEGITWRDRNIIENTNGVGMISEISSGSGSFVIKGDTYSVSVLGVGEKFLDINQDVTLSEGRYFLRGDKAVAIVGWNLANPPDEESLISVGDRIKVSADVKGETKEITIRVIGVLEEHGTMFGINVDDVIAIPFDTYDEFYEQNGNCAVVQAYVKDSDKMDEVEADLEDSLDEDFIVVSPDAALDVQKQVTGTIQAVLGGIAAISMFVAGIGIVNTMAISVSERTKEIGTMKAIGAKSTDILFLFLSEALYTGLIGGIVGSSIGFMLGKMVGNIIGLPVEISIILGVGTIMFALITSLISGASPAWRAAKMNPVEALRKE